VLRLGAPLRYVVANGGGVTVVPRPWSHKHAFERPVRVRS